MITSITKHCHGFTLREKETRMHDGNTTIPTNKSYIANGRRVFIAGLHGWLSFLSRVNKAIY